MHNPKPGGYQYDVTHERTGKTCVRPANGYRYPEHRMKELIAEKRILFGDDDTQIVQIKEYLEEYEGKLASVVVLDSRAGANELEGLFGERKVFTNPKPVSLLSDIFGYCLEPGDVALDFFAGSGTTAQAVVELNVFDGGARRFILVQLPEAVAGKQDFSTIAQITRERVRRVAIRTKKAQQEEDSQRGLFSDGAAKVMIDAGFRAYKLAASNFKLWSVEPNELGRLAEQVEAFTEPLVPGASKEAVLHELILKGGLPLTAEIKPLTLAGTTVHGVEDGRLLICLADPVPEKALRAMLKLPKLPQIVICLDHAFGNNDQLLTNIALEMKDRGVDFRTV
ncbi:MAG: DNA methyltransferase [Polyangia bacterium]